MNLLLITQIVDKEDTNLGFFHTWIQKIAGQVDHLIVLCLKKGSCDLPDNVTVISLGKESGVSRFEYLRRFFRTIFQRRHEYDGVFVHMNPEYVILGGLFWRLMGKRILLWYTHKAVNLRLRIAARLAHGIFTASKTSFRLSSKKVRVVGHGIDVDVFSAESKMKESGGIRCVMVGRVSPVKDIETVLLAWHHLLQHHSNRSIQLDIIGEPITKEDVAYREVLEDLHRELSLGESVRFVGGKSYAQMVREYQKSDMLIHTSKTGSVDKVVLEALAAGLVVLTSSEAYEALGEHVTIFPPNDPKILAAMLEKMLSTGILERNISGAKAVKQQYSLDQVAEKIVGYFSR